MDKRKAVLKLGFLFPIQAAPQFLLDEPFIHMTMLFVLACPCLHGECESGVYGTGHCKPDSCHLGYTGQDCNTSKCCCSVYSY